MQNAKGLRYSALLHGGLLLLMIFGLPEFLEPKRDPEPMAYSVDILPIAPISNVKPQEKPPEKPEPKKPVTEEKTEKKATSEAKKEEVKKPEPEPLPAPKEEKKPEVKKPKEIKKPEKKKKEEDLDSILKSVKDSAKAQESKKPTEKKTTPNQHEARSDRYDPAMQPSMSEIDSIRQQFQKCWNVPAGAKNAQNLVVTLSVELMEDGSVIKVELAKNSARASSDPTYLAAADSAIRAVRRCSPLKNLPAEKYSAWRYMELNFDPKDMLF